MVRGPFYLFASEGAFYVNSANVFLYQQRDDKLQETATSTGSTMNENRASGGCHRFFVPKAKRQVQLRQGVIDYEKRSFRNDTASKYNEEVQNREWRIDSSQRCEPFY